MRRSDGLILSATEWVTNAAMIQDVARLGWLKETDQILDPTWGQGTWWRLWKPTRRQVHARTRRAGWDFRVMEGEDDESYDAIAFDPPYVSPGGRATTTIPKFGNSYGMLDTPPTPMGVQSDINDGLEQCWRVVKRGGMVLVKCQSYVSSGKLWPGTFLTWEHAAYLGFRLEDWLLYLDDPRPQPQREVQKHTRRNATDLLIFRRPKRSK